ncbi:hypothetical protein VNO78_17713 [Psophocarpus tetragonolobus]|uniref:RNase H type-1 domain-containing protein n=1 Tax=Psophocarpus tetragonolobus TaxID=3891 RepID=A0AAN9SI77_PSOTE
MGLLPVCTLREGSGQPVGVCRHVRVYRAMAVALNLMGKNNWKSLKGKFDLSKGNPVAVAESASRKRNDKAFEDAIEVTPLATVVVKGHIEAKDCIADFINKLPPTTKIKSQWTLYVDGSSNRQGSGAGIVLEGPDNILLEQSLKFNFRASNNQAEYKALIARLTLAKETGAEEVKCRSNSQLTTSQLNGEYQHGRPRPRAIMPRRYEMGVFPLVMVELILSKITSSLDSNTRMKDHLGLQRIHPDPTPI